MSQENKWTDKMLMAALVIGVAGAATRSMTPKEKPDQQLSKLMLEFERTAKEELKTLSLKEKSGSGQASLPPKAGSPQP